VSDSQIEIRFHPSGRTAVVLPGVCLLEAAAQAGLTIDTPCGGGGTCGKCRVRFTSDAPTATALDAEHFSPEELEDGWRLACQSHPEVFAALEVPAASLFAGKHQILQSAVTMATPALDCGLRKRYVELSRPTLTDDEADRERLVRQIGECEVPAALLRRLHALLDAQDYRGTAVFRDGTLLDFEPGNTAELAFGVAIDIGTTTLVATLHDLVAGEELAVAARLNSQVQLGDDVLSRIRHATRSTDGLAQLHEAVVGDCRELVQELCASAGVSRRHVYCAAVAGNTTMQHLAAGIDPASLGQVPFIPVQASGLRLPAHEFDLAAHPAAEIRFLPVIGGFVGGDTVAGLIATRLDQRPGPSLLIDIGTNGEIVLSHNGRLWATSAAAGPAFEGARISAGMRAAEGAIENVSCVDGHLAFSTVGGVAARGICGSGLIDVAAELLRCGAIAPFGRLATAADLPAHAPREIAQRLEMDAAGERRFRVCNGDPARQFPPITITQRDVRELQLATGAIRAATTMLLNRAGLAASDLDCILLAGGFGSFIRRSNAQRIGLLPPGIPHERIRFVGNTSLLGAQWVLLSKSVRQKAEELARNAELVEWSTDPDFQNEFAEAMIFPEDGENC
jgi:uncharacterized 2Fe-2S/4Fe-4S cluster protein (DUF4445 family)